MSDKLTLYKINKEMDELLDQLANGEVSEDFEERLAKVKVSFPEKMLAYRAMVHKWTGFGHMIDQEIDRLKAVKASYISARDRLMGQVKGTLEKLEDNKFVDGELGLGFRLQKNSSPKVEILDIDLLEEQHPDCVRVTIERVADKTKIRELYKETGEIPDGTEITEGKHVRVV